MFGTLAELHRWRSRVGIALIVTGTIVLVIGIYFFFKWWDIEDAIFYANANQGDVEAYVVDAWDYGVFATTAFVLGIPILSLGLAHVWLASRRNALIEGAMIERLAVYERGKSDQPSTQ